MYHRLIKVTISSAPISEGRSKLPCVIFSNSTPTITPTMYKQFKISRSRTLLSCFCSLSIKVSFPALRKHPSSFLAPSSFAQLNKIHNTSGILWPFWEWKGSEEDNRLTRTPKWFHSMLGVQTADCEQLSNIFVLSRSYQPNSKSCMSCYLVGDKLKTGRIHSKHRIHHTLICKRRLFIE